MTPQHNSQQSGFTLIELLIAVTIFAVLSTIIYQTFDVIINARQRVDQDLASLDDWQKLWYWVGDDLLHTIPRAAHNPQGTLEAAMLLNDDNQLYFTRFVAYPTPTSAGGVIRVAYSLEDGTLYRLAWDTADLAQELIPSKHTMLEGVSTLEIRLLDQSNTWYEYWPPLQVSNSEGIVNYELINLPQVIEVTLTHENMGEVMRRFPVIKGKGILEE